MSWISDVQARLADPAPRRLPAGEGRRAAVLAMLYVEAGELWILLTQRTDDLPNHQNQIAFPGGGLEADESPWDGAVRETVEELGIEREKIVQLGELDEQEVPSGYRIVPCVGAIPYPIALTPSPAEIAETFSVPLNAFANPTAVEQRRVEIDGLVHDLTIFHLGQRRIWGMTAAVVQNLLERLGLATTLVNNPG